MNRQTFGDAVGGRRSALSNEIEGYGSDEDGEGPSGSRERMKAVDGEERLSRDIERYDENGVQMEAFNLNDEREGGHFDSSGNYVFAKRRKEEDSWLSAMNETEMEKEIGEAMEAKKRRDDELARKAAAVTKREYATPAELKEQIILLGAPRETVAEALQRLSANNNSSSASSRVPSRGFIKRERKNKGAPGPGDSSGNGSGKDAGEAARKEQLLELIDLSDQLLSHGITSIYAMTFEALKNSLVQWEYKGRAADGSECVFGPFHSKDIAKWKAGGYFTGTTAVQMRPVKKCISSGKSRGRVTFLGTRAKEGRPQTKKARLDDLLQDLDDSDDDGDGDDSVGAKTKGGQQQQQEDDELEQQWVSSDLLDFGPAPGAASGRSKDSDSDRRIIHQKEEESGDEDVEEGGNVLRGGRKRGRVEDDDGDESE